MSKLQGIAVSPGVVVGVVYRVDAIFGPPELHELDDPAQIPDQIDRFEKAIVASVADLEAIVKRVSEEVGRDEAAIFQGHLQIVRDPAILVRVPDLIRGRRLTALSALQIVLHEFAARFAGIENEIFRERITDIRDAVSRIGSHLTLDPAAIAASGAPDGDEPVVLVTHELLPSQALSLENLHLAGIVTEIGGGTSHAAILARSRGIPAVSGVTGVTSEVANGDPIVIDGRDGLVIVRPDPETITSYRKMQRDFINMKNRLVLNRDQPAISADGAHVELLANINNPADAEAANAVGATGVGLFRTEYLFLTHHDVPDEEEQYQHYRQVVESAPLRTVTIRTLDLGGDKTVPYLGRRHEANPFMGWRSIRLSFEYPVMFVRQIRAILRAGRHGKVSMLFPMITTLEELRYVNRLVEDARKDLRRADIPYGDDVKTGVMIEVPAAAVCIDALLRETDFISIGSNDLIQYLVAADRDNPKVAHLCDPLSPAIFRVLQMIFDACRRTATPVTVCGEMAGQPRSALALFGMGLRRFSMSPAFVPMIKTLLASVSTAQSERYAHHVLQLKTAEEIRNYLTARLHEVSSDIEHFDSG